MINKFSVISIIVCSVVLMILSGCQSVQDVMRDTVQPEDSMVEATPVKLVYLLDYPEGEKMPIYRGFYL